MRKRKTGALAVLLVFMMCQKNYIEAVSGAVKG